VNITGLAIDWAEAIADTIDDLEAQAYLEGLATNLLCEVQHETGFGSIVDTLVRHVDRFSITDVVIASHGRTGVSRVILVRVQKA
jgi:nucleotide-binding universal stress UspA family protein